MNIHKACIKKLKYWAMYSIIRLGFFPTCKYESRVEVTGFEKHSSLQQSRQCALIIGCYLALFYLSFFPQEGKKIPHVPNGRTNAEEQLMT
jgi:hypothetical protein